MDLQDAQHDVLSFHQKFGHPIGAKPREIKAISYVDRMFRIERIEEETKELVAAIRQGDTAHSIQEAMDLLYVTLGYLVLLGVPVQPFFDAVHSANMEKKPHPDGKLGKPLKPPGWVSPKSRIYTIFQDMMAEAAKPTAPDYSDLSMDFPLEKPPLDLTVPQKPVDPTGEPNPHDVLTDEGNPHLPE